MMKSLTILAAIASLLAAGGAARAAEKETAIDWPARAAMVKVGMTRAEVEKILPIWEPSYTPPLGTNGPIRIGHHLRLGGGNSGYFSHDFYRVSENWQVTVTYSGSSEEKCHVTEPVKIEKVKELAPPKSTP